MTRRNPSSAPLVLAVTALVVAMVAAVAALSGPAVAAASKIERIGDATNQAYVAHVDPSGKLEVGDGDGPLTVDGTTQLAAPADTYHSPGLVLGSSSGCQQLAAPSSGRALVIRQVRVNVYQDPSPGAGQALLLSTSPSCSGNVVGDLNPGGFGLTPITFDPGLAISSTSGLYVRVFGSISADFYADGYSVPAVPTPGRDAAR